MNSLVCSGSFCRVCGRENEDNSVETPSSWKIDELFRNAKLNYLIFSATFLFFYLRELTQIVHQTAASSQVLVKDARIHN